MPRRVNTSPPTKSPSRWISSRRCPKHPPAKFLNASYVTPIGKKRPDKYERTAIRGESCRISAGRANLAEKSQRDGISANMRLPLAIARQNISMATSPHRSFICTYSGMSCRCTSCHPTACRLILCYPGFHWTKPWRGASISPITNRLNRVTGSRPPHAYRHL